MPKRWKREARRTAAVNAEKAQAAAARAEEAERQAARWDGLLRAGSAAEDAFQYGTEALAIQAGEPFDLPVRVRTATAVISYAFAVKEQDVEVSATVTLDATAPVPSAAAKATTASTTKPPPAPAVPQQALQVSRLDASQGWMRGTLRPGAPSVVTFNLSNEYSFFNAKEVTFLIRVADDVETERLWLSLTEQIREAATARALAVFQSNPAGSSTSTNPESVAEARRQRQAVHVEGVSRMWSLQLALEQLAVDPDSACLPPARRCDVFATRALLESARMGWHATDHAERGLGRAGSNSSGSGTDAGAGVYVSIDAPPLAVLPDFLRKAWFLRSDLSQVLHECRGRAEQFRMRVAFTRAADGATAAAAATAAMAGTGRRDTGSVGAAVVSPTSAKGHVPRALRLTAALNFLIARGLIDPNVGEGDLVGLAVAIDASFDADDTAGTPSSQLLATPTYIAGSKACRRSKANVHLWELTHTISAVSRSFPPLFFDTSAHTLRKHCSHINLPFARTSLFCSAPRVQRATVALPARQAGAAAARAESVPIATCCRYWARPLLARDTPLQRILFPNFDGAGSRQESRRYGHRSAARAWARIGLVGLRGTGSGPRVDRHRRQARRRRRQLQCCRRQQQ